MSSKRFEMSDPGATLLHLPVGAVGSRGSQAVKVAALAGLTMDPWQEAILDGSLAYRADGRWAAFETAMVMPRQNGKNAILEARQLAGLFVFREQLQVHSAHEFKTALEHYLRIKELIESTPRLDEEVKIYRTGSADMSIELKTGERLRFVSRTKSSGRGFTGDVIYLDEAFALTSAQMGSLMPTMRAVPNPQLWYSSSAPRHDSRVLHSILNRAGKADDRLFLVAWENPEGTDPADREAWRRVNPAMGTRITEEAMATELRSLGSTEDGLAEFMRECLGVREMPLSHSSKVELSALVWSSAADRAASIKPGSVLAVDVSPEAASAALAAADDDHVGIIHAAAGTRWLLSALGDHIEASDPVAVGVDAAGPAQQILPELRALCKDKHVKLVELPTRALAAACGEFADAVRERRLFHLGQAWLDDAVSAGRRRQYGDAWLWDRRVGADISPLVAVTVARRVFAEVPHVERVPMFAFS